MTSRRSNPGRRLLLLTPCPSSTAGPVWPWRGRCGLRVAPPANKGPRGGEVSGEAAATFPSLPPPSPGVAPPRLLPGVRERQLPPPPLRGGDVGVDVPPGHVRGACPCCSRGWGGWSHPSLSADGAGRPEGSMQGQGGVSYRLTTPPRCEGDFCGLPGLFERLKMKPFPFLPSPNLLFRCQPLCYTRGFVCVRACVCVCACAHAEWHQCVQDIQMPSSWRVAGVALSLSGRAGRSSH